MKVKRESISDQVTEFLRRRILAGDLGPGERLVELKLAAQTGASRTPIREALLRLEREKLVVRRRQGGYRVRPLDAREVEEVIGARAVLESYAVELAARSMTPEMLERLKENVARFGEALAAGDGKRLVTLNTTFHDQLYRMAGSRVLLRLIRELADNLYRLRVSLLGDTQAARRSLADHRRMLEALERGDTAEAASACRDHIWAGGRWILAHMQGETEGDGE